jgi:uncharacterized integral membrane protein (TIGR00698 family)
MPNNPLDKGNRMYKHLFKHALFPSTICAVLIASHYSTLIHQMSAGLALLCGILLALAIGNPFEAITKKYTSSLLSWSVVGLGFGMNLITVMKVGVEGIGYTLFSIAICAALGLGLGKYLQNKRNTSVLITFGTAICGGSAIAAIAPTIRANQQEITVALAVVFALNAVSLFIFPFIGHYFALSEAQFGLWSALAIHDTSSVVGTTMQYGPQALNIGTTVKLARALWIVPLTIVISIVYNRSSQPNTATEKPKRPWFILGFLLASMLATLIPSLRNEATLMRDIAEKTLVVTLFCIGSNLSHDTLKSVGIKPVVQGCV